MAGRSLVLGYGLPLVGVAALLAGATTMMRDQPSHPVERPSVLPPVSPAAAGVTPGGEFIGSTGQVESAGRNIEIASQVGGVIWRVEARVGERISEGDVILTVDARAAESALAQRRADLAAAEMRVRELLATIPPARARVESALAQVSAAQAAVERARGDLAAAESDLGDRRNLLEIAESAASDDARAVSVEVLNTRRFAVRSAEASVQAARAWIAQNQAAVAQAEAGASEARATLATLADPESGADGPTILAARASVVQAQAALDAAQTDLDLHVVRSPIDGMVLQVLARPGQFAPANVAADPLAIVGIVDPLQVRAQVDEVDVPRFATTARAWASPRGDADRRFELRFDHVEPLVVPKRRLTGATSERVDTRVLEVVYSLPAEARGVYVGQQLDVYIEAIPRQPRTAEGTP